MRLNLLKGSGAGLDEGGEAAVVVVRDRGKVLGGWVVLWKLDLVGFVSAQAVVIK
jgi:hypothetical protein